MASRSHWHFITWELLMNFRTGKKQERNNLSSLPHICVLVLMWQFWFGFIVCMVLWSNMVYYSEDRKSGGKAVSLPTLINPWIWIYMIQWRYNMMQLKDPSLHLLYLLKSWVLMVVRRLCLLFKNVQILFKIFFFLRAHINAVWRQHIKWAPVLIE